MSKTAAKENFTLADAEGAFIEVVGAEALRSEFERIFFDKHLSPDQILGLWESNEEARPAIERLFGAEALEAAAERLQTAQAVGKAGDTAAQARQTADVQPKANGSSMPSGATAIPARARRRATTPPSVADGEFLLKIDPTWGDQKVFRHYRAALTAIHNSGQAPEIARFRAANTVVETRLRMKLPHRMTEIDAIYDLALSPEWRA